jgi:uncharacterized protein YcbK (DUF882 family)
METPVTTPITKNFVFEEFACQCGCGSNETDTALIYALQELRDLIGKPIVITSGYRCPGHNEECGGAPASQHPQGMAADIHVAHLPVKKLYAAAEKVNAFLNGGIGVSSTFLHLDIRPDGPARWSYDTDGNTIPFVEP